MGQTHTWHPGTGAIANSGRWPVFTPLMPDEILSSWLARVARGLGCDPMVLTGTLWPQWRCWTRDLDRAIDQESVARLSEESGLETEQLHLATLSPVTQRFAPRWPIPPGPWPWITTLGSRNRLRTGGMQFCPICLDSDVIPYYRLQWRFAWHTACEQHHVALLDRCPICNSSIEFHRLQFQHKHLAKCASCETDLKKTSAEPFDTKALQFQVACDQVLHNVGSSNKKSTVTGMEWLELANFYATTVRRSAYCNTRSLHQLLARLDAKPSDSAVFEHGVRIELMSTANRQNLFALVSQLMFTEEPTLAGELIRSGVTRSAFCPRGQSVPSLLSHLIDGLPNTETTRHKNPRTQSTGIASHRQVMARHARLLRRMRKIR